MRSGQNTEALDNAKRLAEETKDALMKGEILRIGELLDESWQQKKRFTANITNERIDAIYETARENGAVGGKISGAGGGGFMFFICKYDRRHMVAKELQRPGRRRRQLQLREARSPDLEIPGMRDLVKRELEESASVTGSIDPEADHAGSPSC